MASATTSGTGSQRSPFRRRAAAGVAIPARTIISTDSQPAESRSGKPRRIVAMALAWISGPGIPSPAEVA